MVDLAGVLDLPETKYARNGAVSIAYQVFGQGPNLLAVPPAAQNIELAWEDARLRRLLNAIGVVLPLVCSSTSGAPGCRTLPWRSLRSTSGWMT